MRYINISCIFPFSFLGATKNRKENVKKVEVTLPNIM